MRFVLPVLLVAALFAGSAAGAAGAATAGAAQVRLGAAPAFPRGAQLLAGVASTTSMPITVVLEPRDPAALAAYAQAVATPGSPVFHDYLTPAQFASRYGSARASATAVQASLRAHGLPAGRLAANGLSISLSASAGALERAFSLSFARLELPGGSDAVINTAAPAVDARIAGSTQAVLGLSSLEAMRPLRIAHAAAAGVSAPAGGSPLAAGHLSTAHVVTGGPQACPTASSAAPPQDAYTSDQIAAAYNFSGLYQRADEGQGVTIATYELESYDPSDIAQYQSCYGTNASITNIGVDGGPRETGPGSGEAALDIEQLIAFAPRASILVYQGPNSNSNGPGAGPYDVFSAIISQDRAQVLTNSWGNCEPDEGQADAAAENVLFEEAATQGQTVVSASGDSGSEDCYAPGPDGLDQGSPSQLAVDDPASQPLVTGVGGTSLPTLGPPPSETAWNNTTDGGAGGIQPGAGGGGVSSFWSMPAFQASAPASLRVIAPGLSSAAPCGARSGYCRQVPDVSADADPDSGYLIYFNGSDLAPGEAGWQGTGGTSGATPLWAALFALADALPACKGSTVGFADPALYGAAATAGGESSYFHDITTGETDFTGGGGGRYPAAPGYDMATGLGSPNAAALAGALCANVLRLTDPGAQRTFAGAPVALKLSATDASGRAISFAAGGLPRGLAIDAATGLISGRPRVAGAYRVRLKVTDTVGSQHELSFLWTVQGRPAVSHVSLTALASGRPTLALTLTAGREEPGIDALTIALPAGLWLSSKSGVSHATGSSTPRSALAVVGDTLALRLRRASPKLALRLAYDLLRARAGLIRSASKGARSKLTLTLTVTDAGGGVSTIPVTVRARP